MKTPAQREMLEEIMGVIQRQFYPDDFVGFCKQRRILVQAVTYPAWYLSTKGMEYPETRYRTLMMGILDDIKRKGNTAHIGYFCAYLLKCVQEHMKHHGEGYLEEAKKIQRQIDDVLHGIKSATPKTPKHDGTVERLVAARRLMASPMKKKAKPVTAEQPTLFKL